MSQSIGVLDLSFVAEADLRTLQYCVVTAGTAANSVKKCGTSDVPLGVLQNKPNTGEPASVRVLGTSKVYADGAFAYGDQLAVADANGEVDTVGAAPVNIIGIALEAAGKAHVYVEMFVNRAFEGSSIAPAALTAACTQKQSFTLIATGNLIATIGPVCIGRAGFDGNVVAAGFKEGTNGIDGTDDLTRELTVTVGAVNVNSTKAKLIKSATGAAGTFTAGAGVTPGVLNASNVAVVEGDFIYVTWTLTRTTPETEIANLTIQVDIEGKVGA